MIAGAIGGLLLREIPGPLLLGLASGEYRLFGSTIRQAANGRIVGFLQEAAPRALQTQNPVLASVSIAADLGQLVQGELIRAGVKRLEAGMAVLKTLGAANLAVSTAGLGVSLVGFAVMSARIEAVRKAVDALSDQIADVGSKIDQIQQDAVDLEFVEIQALARSADEAWRLSDAAAESRWREVARAALHHQARFELRAMSGTPSPWQSSTCRRRSPRSKDRAARAGGISRVVEGSSREGRKASRSARSTPARLERRRPEPGRPAPAADPNRTTADCSERSRKARRGRLTAPARRRHQMRWRDAKKALADIGV